VATLEPVVIVVRSKDLDFLRQVIDRMEPMPPEVLKAIRFNGWDEEQVRLGQLLTSVAALIQSGDLDIVKGTDDA
jgi:hypothetical protein